GAETLKKITTFCEELGIKTLTVYAFSTENWSRPKKEVDNLMSLLLEYLSDAKKELGGKNTVIKIIGDVSPFSEQIKEKIKQTEALTEKNTGMTLNIALNYGARAELVTAIKGIVNDGVKPEDITEQTIERYLYTANNPPVDLVIRPSGELRLSNFLLWQSAYAELWFSDILWPDFNKKHLLRAITDYQNRSRRYGGV
ncbi:MAG: di-trans,poly-cis-decaprenylcistransferase, partial [Clostridiaceae bacterium]|nr:di-trans,poly-cis-decaprenylcistransferase [Clostridiaceae bacterium]